MKITNTKTGEAYQLTPGTQLEIERPNLFFNEYGEQSLPVDLPDTDRNRRLCGYANLIAGTKKPEANLECSIEHGGFFSIARQAILSAKAKEGISTSFYLNEGAFLSKLKDVSLKDVFGDETVPDVEGVDACIAFCRGLLDNSHPQFALFPVYVDDGSFGLRADLDLEEVSLTPLNKIEWLNDNGFGDGASDQLHPDFWFAWPRTIKKDGNEIQVPAGCYITPFIRANYLLERIFQHFGYDLQPHFFLRTAPFMDMVFLNNTCDTLLNGRIRLADLVPDCTCNTVLDVFRHSFLCEFVPDESAGIVYLKLFNEVLDEQPAATLDGLVDGNVEIEYPEAYREIVLKYEQTLSAGNNPEQMEGAGAVLKAYPDARLDAFAGFFAIYGYNGLNVTENGSTIAYEKKVVSASSTPYNAGSGLEQEEITIPGMQPEFRNEKGEVDTTGCLCVGASRWLNSTLLDYAQEVPEGGDRMAQSEDNELPPMLAFCCPDPKTWPSGTVSYAYWKVNESGFPWQELLPHSLLPNGSRGLFETFYRRYDDILRNSFHLLRVSLLMDDRLKLEMDAFSPLSLQGQTVLPDILHYTLGKGNNPQECQFRTIRLYDPQSHAPENTSLQQELRQWQWMAHHEIVQCSKDEYDNARYKDQNMETVYPRELPTAEMAENDQRFYPRTWYTQGSGLYWKHDFYMTVVPV